MPINLKPDAVDVIVDSREKEHVRKRLLLDGIPYVVEALPVGDYIVKTATSKVTIERKSISDFVGSWFSGRLDTQLTKLAQEPFPILLITGTYEEVKKYLPPGMSNEQLIARIAEVTTRYGLRSVVWVQGVDGSPHVDGLIMAVKFLKEIAKGNLDKIPDRRIKSDDHPQRELVKLTLGVPNNVAISLLKKFGNIRNIINASNDEISKVEGVGPLRLQKMRLLIDGIWTDYGKITAICDKDGLPMICQIVGNEWVATCFKCNSKKTVKI